MLLGIDVRDTDVVALIADERGGIVARARAEGSDIAAVHRAVGALGDHQPTAIGAAVFDPADPALTDRVAAAVQALHASTARIVTKGSAVALAEHWCGAARDATHVVALSADDRVDAGLILNGTLFEGAHGRAGAAQWLALNPAEREDYRKVGCLESEAGASGIVRRFVWRVKAGDMSRAADAAGDLSALTVGRILDAARAGDGVAISVVRDTARYLGMTIGNLVSLIDPDVIVLGGLYAEASDLLIEQSRSEAARFMAPHLAESVHIVAGAMGDDAGALGASRAAMLAR